MSRITIGVSIYPQHTSTAEHRNAFQQAEEIGADTIWTWVH